MPRPRKATRSKRRQQQHEARRRKILHADQPWLRRIEYVCDQLFASDVKAFAHGIELDPLHLSKVFNRQYAITVQLLAQILSHTNVRADWLLWGNGPMLNTPEIETPAGLVLPQRLYSSFPVFDTLQAVTSPRDAMTPYAIEQACSATDAHIEVAQLIHKARSENQPVLLFIGASAINAGAGIVAIEMLRKKYVTAMATTGAGLLADIRTTSAPACDLNYIARMAANQGLGYGEAVGRWAFAPKDNKTRSLLHAAHEMGVPATVHVEIGEMVGHCCPAARGAELGAAIGAATYVDLMVFAEQVRQLCATQNGVVLLIGDAMRGLHLFLQTRASIPHDDKQPGFHAVLFDNHVQPDFASTVNSHNGAHYKLSGTYRANVSTLLNVCDGVFSGQITKTVDSYSGVSG